MACKNWLCTLNKPEEDPKEYLEKFHRQVGAVYVVGQLEKGAEGTPHIQFFVNFKDSQRISRLTKIDRKGHYEQVKVNNGADKYCMKEDSRLDGPWEYGVRPVIRSSKTDWKQVFEDAKNGNLDAIPDDIKVKHYGNLKRIEKDHLTFTDHSDVKGYWYWGPTGLGKSKTARENFPNFYPKLCNKWWDGYQGQPHVIMDDLGPDHECLGQ